MPSSGPTRGSRVAPSARPFRGRPAFARGAAILVGVLSLHVAYIAAADSLRVPISWSGYRAEASLENDNGRPVYRVWPLDASGGESLTLDPDEFARRELTLASHRTPLESLFNVSGALGIAWVLFGLAGQAVFAGRMVVQWALSERRRESIVPPIFWWMSLVGSLMLLTYFLWRHDIVGILGQSLGLAIYVRNLVLIRNSARRAGAEPILA